MPTVLHDLVVARPRDLFRVRQRARQIAGTLRFSPHEQLYFAVTVFDLACQSWKRQGQEIDDFPNLKRWQEAIQARPAANSTKARPGPW